MRAVCPICGREADFLIDGMCPTCYAERHKLIEVREGGVQLLICKSCLSAYQRGRWARDWRQAAQKAALGAVKVNGALTSISVQVEGEPRTGLRAVVRARGRLHESLGEAEVEAEVPIRVLLDLCPTCRYVYTEREAAVIQIRSAGRPIDGDLKLALEGVMRITLAKSDEVQRGAVIDVKEVDGGMDVRLTNANIAKSMVMAIHRSFPSKVVETEKVVGERGGRHVSKSIFSVRIINLRRGDEVMIDGTRYVIRDVRDNSIDLADEEGRRINMSIDRLLKRRMTVVTE